jgi:hypothetical protein
MTPQQQLEYKAPSHMAKAGGPITVVSPAPLIGTWNNTNHATNDIVKIIIAAAGGGISVQVFGACSPSACAWGSAPAIPVAGSVTSSPAVGFSAHYTFSFAQVLVVGHLQGQHLELETFTEFTDNSGRSNLYTTDQMAK